MAHDAEVLFLTGYSCPGCRSELDIPSPPPDSWLRCPRCGRPSLPPIETAAASPWITVVPTASEASSRRAFDWVGVLKYTAPVVLVIALCVDIALRVLGVDETARMLADVVAFTCFAICVMLVLRAMIRA
jgi:hypothetical protein